MKTQLSRWGNSLAVRIPKYVAEAATLKEGDPLEIAAEGEGTIALRRRKRKRTLKELISAITPENLHGETDWGERRGNESW
jgi:antitoxin MazE